MMRKCLSMLLAISMLFGSVAIAEEAAPVYQPGSVISGLFSEAFAGGSMVCADVDLSIELNNEALGLEGQEAEMADAVAEMINTAIISGAAAKTEDALILSIAADYTKEEGAQGARAGARIGLSKEGLYVETSLLPGERVSATWETVLGMLGVDEATAQRILQLRDIDPALLKTQLEQLAVQLPIFAQQFLTPYADIVTAFIGTLPASAEENVEAEGYFPAAKTKVTLTLTQKAAGELIAQLADQLACDPVLVPVLDALLTNPEIMGENAMTTGALCENIRALAAQMTDESNPVYIFFGYDENDALLYGSTVTIDAEGTTTALNIVDMTATAADGSGYIVELFMTDAGENYTGMSASWLYQGDPADRNTFDLSMAFDVTLQNTTLMSMEYGIGCAPMTTEENLPGYSGYQSVSMSITESESATPVNVVSYAETQQYMTADGGETLMTYGTTDTYVGETSTQATAESYFAAIPSEEGPIGRYVEVVAQPANGVNSATIDYELYTVPYEPMERTNELALDTATQEEIDALLLRLMTNAQGPMDALFAQLPAPILELITGDLTSEVPADTEPAVAL